MAPGWRNRFVKHERFQKLDDDDDLAAVDDLASGAGVESEKKTLLLTPSLKHVGTTKVAADAAAPLTPSTTAPTTPSSVYSSSSSCSNSSRPRSTHSRSLVELDGLASPHNSPTFKHAGTTDDDLVEIYEAEDDTSASFGYNNVDNIDSEYDVVLKQSPSAETDTSFLAASTASHGTDSSEDVYVEGSGTEKEECKTLSADAAAAWESMVSSSPVKEEQPSSSVKSGSAKSSVLASPTKEEHGSVQSGSAKSGSAKSDQQKQQERVKTTKFALAKLDPPVEKKIIKPLVRAPFLRNKSAPVNAALFQKKKEEEEEEVAPIEIQGVDLMVERDHSLSELQEMSHLMTFNALILIQKQKDWLEGSSSKSANLLFELENMERKIKLLSDHKEWPNETERKKQEKDPLTPSKAFFKAMSLLDRSIEQFHQGYLQFTAQKSQENHELKRNIETLQAKNSSLVQETQTQKNTIQNLENERNDLAKQVKQMEKHLALVKIKQEDDDEREFTSNNNEDGTFLSKVFNIKAYIETLEEQQRNQLEEIKTLKSKVAEGVKDEEKENDEEAAGAEKQETELQRASSGDSGYLDDDLGSRWHTLQANEEATEKAADLERQVGELCTKLADREADLASLRSECKLIRMQLLQEERTRNEFKAQLKEKDSLLSVSEQRIASLEEEVLKTHARCATFEEDYAALKDSFAAQKEATLKEMTSTTEENKAKIDKMQSDYETRLQSLEEQLSKEVSDRERLVRDLKSSLGELESERNQLQEDIANLRIIQESNKKSSEGEEKKEQDSEDKAAYEQKMKKLEDELKQFERMRERLAEKACAQASTIATLQEENENKEAQLASLNEMIESLIEEREAGSANQLRQRMFNLRDKVRERADIVKDHVINRSQHGY